ncbi:hypothetical protein PRIPAC_73656 [Pristionchus pacificus]|nr:hypothetical protein PRIPAC_73656 [Pristionchus pacificus]|eukprot:PDM81093.1 hypothetical protein PRIPAC_36096 [Pristionchus pacificus]
MHRAFKQDADGASSSLGTTRPPESRELFSDLSTVGGGGTNNGERPPKRTFDGSPRKELKRKRREKAGKMASFIFFDLESTGLFTRCPHMTEASFVVVSRGAFEAAVEKMRKKAGEQGENPEITVQTPVPANIHTRQLRPNLSEDQWRMYENIRRPESQLDHRVRSGWIGNGWVENRVVDGSKIVVRWMRMEAILIAARITRAVLSEKATFAEEWPGLRHVLKTAPKPTCIVAHNALRYDMRVLHVELQRAALLEDGWLPEEVYFVDSLLAFRQIDREDATHISSLVGGTDWMTIASMCSTPPDPPRARPARIPMIEEREEDVVEETPPGMWSAQYWSPSLRFAYSLATRSAERLYEMKSLRSELRKRLDQHAAGDGLLQLPAALEGGGFTTPERRPRCPGTASAPAKLHTSRALFPEVFLDFSHPLNYIRSEEWTVAKRKRVDGRVFRKVAGKWQYNVEAAMENAKRRGAFRQENLYMSIFCDTYNAHQAQDDCEALMQICLAYGPSFLEYADTMAADIIY